MEQKPLETGDLVKIWKYNRGHDYVVVGVSGRNSAEQIHLLKNNCINNDGSIHASTTTIHKSVDILEDEDGYLYAAGVTRIVGKREVHKKSLGRFLKDRAKMRNVVPLNEEDYVYAPTHIIDARVATHYA